MTNKKLNLAPLRYITIVKDVTKKEMAQYFEMNSSYFSEIINGKRIINKNKLLMGLKNLNINYGDYLELEALSYDLSLREDIDNLIKYRMMLVKAIGVVAPSEKKKCEDLLNKIYKLQENKKIQSTQGKKRVKIVEGKIIMY